MTQDQYEQFYQNALRTLDLFGVRVGKPFTKNGKRYCAIDRRPRTDQEVFFTTWGRDRANLLTQGSEWRCQPRPNTVTSDAA